MSIVSIANQAQLNAALSKAVGGETFVLAPGNYGAVSFNGRNFSSQVTIQSQSPGLAKMTEIKVLDSSNIALKGLDVGRAMTPAEQDFGKMVSVYSSRNITLDSVSLHGSLDNNPKNDGWGLYVTDSSGFNISNSNLTELSRGMVIQRSSGVTVAANHFSNMRSDGSNFAAVDTVTIKDNHFTNFHPVAGDHPDAIQFWTTGQTKGSANITITGNQIIQGSGAALQGIFMRDEVGTLPFKNVKIDNNLIYGSDAWHGISVYHGQTVAVTNNTVVSRSDDNPVYWIRVEHSSGAVIQKNVVDQVFADLGNTSTTQSGNLVLNGNAAATHMVPNLNKGAATTVADLLVAGYGYHAGGSPSVPITPPPVTQPPVTPPATVGKIFYGTAGSESVNGTSASDTIYGVAATGANPGHGSFDRLIGRGGNDLFVLGDHRGAFYQDNNNANAGRADYAQILDFNAGDRIQLAGALSNYVFHSEKVLGHNGTSIFLDTNGDHKWSPLDEMIAHVANVNLSASALTFVAGTGTQTVTAPAVAPAAKAAVAIQAEAIPDGTVAHAQQVKPVVAAPAPAQAPAEVAVAHPHVEMPPLVSMHLWMPDMQHFAIA